jgi:hypothetical protein
MILIKKKSVFRRWVVSLATAAIVSACGGGTGDRTVREKSFDRIGLDVYPYLHVREYGKFIATIDQSANITFLSMLPNYEFTFPSGLPGGSASGTIFQYTDNSANKAVTIASPTDTKSVQNVFWNNTEDPNYFGLSLVGFRYRDESGPLDLQKRGTAFFKGQALQYIIDNSRFPTTYALFASNATAQVDYSANTYSISIAPNPILLKSVGNPDVINPALFAANYTVTNMNNSGVSTNGPGNWSNPPISGLGLLASEERLAIFGSHSEELAGIITYLTPSEHGRQQYISFALAKQ